MPANADRATTGAPNVARVKKAVVIAVVAVVALGVGAWFARDVWQEHQRCKTFGELATKFGTDPIGSGPLQVAVIGDSYAEGMELDQPRHSWVATFASAADATVSTDAVSGTGFTNAGPCEQGDYVSRASPGADLLVLQGGLNDVGATDNAIREAACEVVGQVRSEVVIIGPPAAPARDRDEVVRIDNALESATLRCGGQYVSTLDWDLTYTDGGLHMTPDGHVTFGTQVAERIAR